MKKLLKLTFTLLIASSLFACNANKETTNTNNSEVGSEASSNDNQSLEQEVTITHSKGETTVKTNPKKVVVFDMGTLDTMQKLGVEAEFALPVDSVPSYIEGFEDAINAGGLKEPDLEGIYTFAPDVIFISGRQADFYDELNKIAPTIYVGVEYENYMESFKTSVLNIGKIFDKEDLALEEYNKIETKIAEAKEKTSNIEDKALIIMTTGGKLKYYGAGSRFGIIHDELGFKEADSNKSTEVTPTTHGDEVSFEYISQVNPDILFVIDRDDVVSGSENTSSNTLNNDLINSTNAVKNNKVVNLNPEVWYIAGNGLQSVNTMIDEAMSVLN